MATTQVTVTVSKKNSTSFSPAVSRTLISDNILYIRDTPTGTLIGYDNPQSSSIDLYTVSEEAFVIQAAMTAPTFGTVVYFGGVVTSFGAFLNKLRFIEQLASTVANTIKVFFDAGRNHTANLKEIHLFLQDTLGSTVAITAVSATAFTVATDLTTSFPAGKSFVMSGSTANDGIYTVVSSTFGAATVITVAQVIPDLTVDGSLKY